MMHLHPSSQGSLKGAVAAARLVVLNLDLRERCRDVGLDCTSVVFYGSEFRGWIR